MSDQSQTINNRLPMRSKQQERAQRILDAAKELILRWGYDKTTVDDISQKADVAKGTIYLHWKTREELFEALVRRESLDMMEDFKQRIAADPRGATLRGIYKHAALALIKRPLLKAFLLVDQDVLGRLARVEHDRPFYEKRLSGFFMYLDFLREHGLIRADLSNAAQMYTVSAIFCGFFMIEPLVPNGLKQTDEEIAELIGESIHRTLETGREISAEQMQDLSAALMAYLAEIQNNTAVQIQQMQMSAA